MWLAVNVQRRGKSLGTTGQGECEREFSTHPAHESSLLYLQNEAKLCQAIFDAWLGSAALQMDVKLNIYAFIALLAS